MALKGQAKTDYMREWMKQKRLDPVYKAESNRVARERARGKCKGKSKGKSNGECQVCGYSATTDAHHEGSGRTIYILCPNCHALVTRGIKTMGELLTYKNVTPVKGQLDSVGLKLEGKRIIGVTKQVSQTPPVQSNLPIYNSSIHKAGDKVRVFDGKGMVEMVVPDLDADGNPIIGAMSQCHTLVSNKIFTPAFRPVAKPLSKAKGKKW